LFQSEILKTYLSLIMQMVATYSYVYACIYSTAIYVDIPKHYIVNKLNKSVIIANIHVILL